MKRRTGTLSLALTACALLAMPAAAQDPLKVDGKIYKKLLDNNRVRALEVLFKPGTKIAMHTHPDHLVYVLDGGMDIHFAAIYQCSIKLHEMSEAFCLQCSIAGHIARTAIHIKGFAAKLAPIAWRQQLALDFIDVVALRKQA